MVDIDVTQEIMSLAEGGVGAMKELIKISGMIGMGVWKLSKGAYEKRKVDPRGLINYKVFDKMRETVEIDSRELGKPVDVELLNRSLKKYRMGGYLKEDPKHPRIYYARDKELAFGLVLKDYETALLEKAKLEEQYSEEKEGMLESQVENVRKNNQTADELFFTDKEKTQQAPFMYSVLDEEKKDRINEAQLHNFQKDEMSASDVKKTLDPPEGPTGKDIRIGEENKSLNQVLNKIRLTGDAAQDRANIAEKIHAEIPEDKNFASLMNDKAICFLDNNDHVVLMDMVNYSLTVSSLSEEEKERIQNILSNITELKENIRMDLDMTLPQDFPDQRKRFIQEMYENCIINHPGLKEDVNAIRNFMTVAEDKKELTWKDVLLWEVARDGAFEYAMVKMDAEQIENIYAARVNGIPDEYIQHMIRYEFSADQMRGTINMLLDRQDASVQDMDELAGDIEGKQDKIKETLVRGYAEGEDERKMTFKEVKVKLAEEKLGFMARDEKGISKVEEFTPEGKEPDHEDENGRWFEAYRNSYGDRIFVNEDKTEVKYEVRIDSEPLTQAEKNKLEKQGCAYQDRKGTKYYKDRGNLVNENGKSVKQQRASYQAKEPVQREPGDMAKKAERKADRGRG